MIGFGITPCLLTICLSGPASAWDGDTWRQSGMRLRLYGVQAIERGDPGWQPPRDALAALTHNQRLACDTPPSGGVVDRDRIVVRCFNEAGQDISCLMAAMAGVEDWPKFSLGAYAPCEEPLAPAPRPEP